MRYIAVLALLFTGAMLVACNTSGLSKQPRATFAQLACYDLNDDGRLNAADAEDTGNIPDFNADFRRTDDDAEFFRGVDIPLDPDAAEAACASGDAPEYLVAHGYVTSSDVSCDGNARAVLLVGISGGVVDLKEKDDASGVRSIVDGLQRAYDELDVQTIAVIAGPTMAGAENGHTAMEDWVTNAVRVYLDRFDCVEAVLAGHSHGAITADVVAARLEGEYGERFVGVVSVDRVDALYKGNTTERPAIVPVFNIYQANDALRAQPVEAANVENWDASAEQEMLDGRMQPVSHTTIDNAAGVRDRIAGWVLAHWVE